MSDKVDKEKQGFQEALKLLWALSPIEQKRLLEDMERLEPEMAMALKDHLVTFEHLIYLTQTSLIDLLKKIEIRDLALSLRIGSVDLKNHLLSLVSKGMRQEMEEVLNGPPRPVDEVQEAQAKIMSVVKAMVESGTLVLSEEKDEYV